ncbi:MAG TPA: VirB3 family type IV secretion system protein [Polyangia bacterium]|nr:VirB3 family type IV secretion system protein [Polyangia bacterium]
MPQLPEGFEVPIHRSLTEPILIGGLPRNFAILLWTPGMVVILGLYQLWFLPIQLAVHLVFVFLTRRDPDFFEVFKRALRAQRRLEP